jgi:hypothetical protein
MRRGTPPRGRVSPGTRVHPHPHDRSPSTYRGTPHRSSPCSPRPSDVAPRCADAVGACSQRSRTTTAAHRHGQACSDPDAQVPPRRPRMRYPLRDRHLHDGRGSGRSDRSAARRSLQKLGGLGARQRSPRRRYEFSPPPYFTARHRKVHGRELTGRFLLPAPYGAPDAAAARLVRDHHRARVLHADGTGGSRLTGERPPPAS